MSNIESQQMILRLSTDPEIIAQLRVNRLMKKDEEGEYLPIQFNSATFYFRPGENITVNRSVGNALIRTAAIIIGDHLTGDMVSAVEKVRDYEVLRGIAEFECPFCHISKDANGKGFNKNTFANHLMRFCDEAQKHHEETLAAEKAAAEALEKASIGNTKAGFSEKD